MCGICIRDCKVLCMISKSAFRGHEVLYPTNEYFGQSTASANKDFGLDWSHLQLLAALQGAEGIEADSDVALFPNADASTSVGGIPLKVPMLIAGLGSTAVAKNHWEGIAMGSAMAGTIQTVGENVVEPSPAISMGTFSWMSPTDVDASAVGNNYTDVKQEARMQAHYPPADEKLAKSCPSRFRNSLAVYRVVRTTDCVACGKCAEVCRYGVHVKAGRRMLTPKSHLCQGSEVCRLAGSFCVNNCPVDALRVGPDPMWRAFGDPR